MNDPVLIACSHGTRVPAGRRTMALLRLAISKSRPEIEVRAAHIDVHKPRLEDVTRQLATRGRLIVIVPLLLSTGYHVTVDIARAVKLADGLAVAAPALGPDPSLVSILQQRLLESGATQRDSIVLAAAGSSDPKAGADVETVAAALAAVRETDVTIGYLAAATPSVSDAVRQARSARPDHPVAIATYLLAPGHFAGRLAEAGADRIAAPLAPDQALAELALRRYDECR